ncbi:hypothetical protein KP509_13G036700 [Ceratopteris richardii]|uniref:Uncharacterized protein n=1 Tax=Ceratopteris richardii TaxID=49495 RepID=A0A8T2TK76_CERRI|nr:hypothetical protein KP509_13G036700 [Ceratopteris richardii]
MESGDGKLLLPWQWILEHLLVKKDIGTPILKEIMMYIPSVDQSGNLHRRVAVRYLEEAIAGSKIDAQSIPLVAALMKEAYNATEFPTSSDYKTLLLRVKIEAVITHIRGKQRDWHGFSEALDSLFPENVGDSFLMNKRRELLTLLQGQRQEKIMEILGTYSVADLQCEMLKFIAAEKERLGCTFLDKLSQDVQNGQCPLSAQWMNKSASGNEESQEDIHSAEEHRVSITSDDETIIIQGRRSDVAGEEVNKTNPDLEATHPEIRRTKGEFHENRRKRHAVQGVEDKIRAKRVNNGHPDLRPRDQQGTADMSLHAEFLKFGSDGHEEVCHKCKEGGRLLCCDGCPIAVHKKCLGYELKNVIGKEWFCPLCSRRQAAQALLKAKEEELMARERLQHFMSSSSNCSQKQAAQTVMMSKEAPIARERLLQTSLGEGAEEREAPRRSKRISRKSVNEKEDDAKKIAKEIQAYSLDAKQDDGKKFREGKETNQSLDGKQGDVEFVKKPTSIEVSSDKSKEHSEQPSSSFKRSLSVDPYEQYNDVSSKGYQPTDPSNSRSMAINQGDRKEELVRELGEQIGDHAANTRSPLELPVEATTMGQTDVGSSSKAHKESQMDNQIEEQEGDGDGHDGDLEEEIRRTETESTQYGTSKPKRHQSVYARGNRIIPGIRRKRLIWTKEEEDALREGVKRFSHDNGSWGFQWTRILEFGQGRFHPSRTDVDLKDKWRNLAKICK